jgi:hypothetical protein
LKTKKKPFRKKNQKKLEFSKITFNVLLVLFEIG